MSKEKEERVHIYLKSDGKNESAVLEGASAHERYIILMNDTLQLRAENQLGTIKELEARIETLEEEVDRSDTRRNYVKGLLKNFHEMHKWNEELAVLEYNMKKEIREFVRSYRSRAAWHLRVLHTLFCVVLALGWEFAGVWDVALLGSLLAVIVAFQYSMLQNLTLPACKKEEANVKELNVQKKKVLKAQDYIHEFIDSQ
jgi:hypothetical protein